jgi:hypothetical protein
MAIYRLSGGRVRACVMGFLAFILMSSCATSAEASSIHSRTVAVTVRNCVDMTVVAPNGRHPCWVRRARVFNGAPGTMVCWYDDPGVNGRITRWFWMRFANADGFVWAGYVKDQTPTPNCGAGAAAERGPAVLNFAYKRRWQTDATQAEHAQLAQMGGDAQWEPGPYGEWAGDCVRFSWFAWAASGISPQRGSNATQMGDAYAGRLQGGTPPVGAMVFYYGAHGLGHVAISLGNGYTVGTTGFDGNHTPIFVKPVVRPGLPYRGWAYP